MREREIKVSNFKQMQKPYVRDDIREMISRRWFLLTCALHDMHTTNHTINLHAVLWALSTRFNPKCLTSTYSKRIVEIYQVWPTDNTLEHWNYFVVINLSSVKRLYCLLFFFFKVLVPQLFRWSNSILNSQVI